MPANVHNMVWEGLDMVHSLDEHACPAVCKNYILSNFFNLIFFLFFLLYLELCYVISRSKCTRWLHGNKCECRVESKQERRAGDEMLRGGSGAAQRRLRRYSEDAQELLKVCSGDAQELLGGMLRKCSEDA